MWGSGEVLPRRFAILDKDMVFDLGGMELKDEFCLIV